jgi:NADH:ubiquinone oxidoreductase subunit
MSENKEPYARARLEDLYRKALAAAKELPADKKRKLLEDMAWDHANAYGPGSKGTGDGGVRWLNTPGSGFMTPIHQVSDEALRHAADLNEHGGIPFYVSRVGKENLIKKKVTIYKKSEFGMGHNSYEASAYFAQSRPYAQFRNAFEVTFIPKGAQKLRHYYETSHPSTLILEGWGHPSGKDLVQTFTTPISKGNITTSVSRHLSHSAEWDKEFAVGIDPYIKTKKVKVILDLRS